MPFFPQAYLSPDAHFLQILSELDRPQQQQQQKTCVRRGPHHAARAETFTPRFDITEVAQAYELFGELPGLEQSDISIEFTDAQTIVIKGKTERPTTSAFTATETTQKEAEVENEKTSDTASEKSSHTATVEDEYDEADTPLATPATATETAAPAQEQPKPEAQTPRPKYWVAERKVGEFARSFSFSQRIEQDAVTASLKNGILHVVVPKSQKSQKVAVSVF